MLPHVYALYNCGDNGVGNPATGGINNGVFADVEATVGAAMDAARAGGIRRFGLLRCWGSANPLYKVGTTPPDYPGGEADIGCEPQTESIHVGLVGTSYRDQLRTCIQARPWILDLRVQSGCIAFTSATDAATLDANSATVRLLAETVPVSVRYDAQSPLAFCTTMDPSDLGATLKAWYKADAGVFSDAGVTPAVDGALVQQWNDQSGNANHLSQATATNKPNYQTNEVNSLPIVRFDGTDNFMAMAAALDLPAFTIFAVLKTTAAADQCLLSRTGANKPAVLINFIAGGVLSSFDGTNLVRSDVNEWTNAQYGVATFSNSGSALDIFADKIETAYVGAQTYSTAASINRVGNNGFNETAWLNGDVAEIIICDSQLTDAQRLAIEGYLATKYGTPRGKSPHQLHVEREFEVYRRLNEGESWERRDVPEIQGWLGYLFGINADHAGGRPALAMANQTLYQNPVSMHTLNLRPCVTIALSDGTVAQRLALQDYYMSLGCDVEIDLTDATAIQLRKAFALEAKHARLGGRRRHRLRGR